MLTVLQFFLHLDLHLAELVANYGPWVYAILFLIVFAETGLVVTPFLPGDSLIFVAGALAAVGGLNPWILALSLMLAAALGNTSNYWIGRWIGPRVFHWEHSRWFNRRAVDRTHAFYVKHGALTIVLARFIPIVRTFAPFVAGIAAMRHSTFQVFSIASAVAWVGGFTLLGYLFGNVPFVQKNLGLLMVAIVLISVSPMFVAWVRTRVGRAGNA